MKNATVKRFLTVALAGVMALSLAACGGSGGGQSKASDSVQTENGGTDSGEEAKGTANIPSWLHTDSLPLVDEDTEKSLSMYILMSTDAPDPEEVWMFDFIEEVMNINLEVTKFTSQNANEVLATAFASGDLPDMIISGNFSANDLVSYGIMEEQIIDLEPYINETNMPRLTAIFEQRPDYRIPFTDSEGHIWSLGFITDTGDPEQVDRAFLNYDFLEENGIKIPETLDEFTEAMRAFKAKDPNNYPIGGSYTHKNPMSYILNAFGYVISGFDGVGGSIALRDGKVVLPMADREAYGEFIRYMNMIYTEGLIHPDFFTMDETTAKAVIADGRSIFVTQAPFVYIGDDYDQWWGALPLTSEYNPAPQWPVKDGAIRMGRAVVTSACEEPELAAAFIDWFFEVEPDDVLDENSKDMKWTNYEASTQGPFVGANPDEWLLGRSGIQWNYDDWSYAHADQVNNPGRYNSNADYIIKEIQLWSYFQLGTNLNDTLSSVRKVSTPVNNFDISAYDDPADSRKDYPNGQYAFVEGLRHTVCNYLTTDVFPSVVYFDVDTADELHNIKTVLDDYATNEVAKFITGARSLDELDQYFDEMERLGALEYVQAFEEYYQSIQ